LRGFVNPFFIVIKEEKKGKGKKKEKSREYLPTCNIYGNTNRYYDFRRFNRRLNPRSRSLSEILIFFSRNSRGTANSPLAKFQPLLFNFRKTLYTFIFIPFRFHFPPRVSQIPFPVFFYQTNIST